ncbi:MAG: ABC transporter ATP-binding protein [Burkholderiales bacterium]
MSTSPVAPLIKVEELVKRFPAGAADVVHAVNGVSFAIAPGEAVGLVGESGSGKSTIGLLVTRLLMPTTGRIVFDGEDITTLTQARMRPLRAALQIVFQNPWGAFNPRMTVGSALEEPLLLHMNLSNSERAARVRELADQVRIPSAALDRYPHELSGGQLQRIGIARAFATRPRLIVLDEPTSSLDLSVRAGVLALLDEIRRATGVALLYISHDLETVELVTDRVLVLYLGTVVEAARTADLFARPAHPYTQALLSATLKPDPLQRTQRHILQGEIPRPTVLPSGCVFASRCPIAVAACAREAPVAITLSNNHVARCSRIEHHRLPATTAS